MVLAKAFVRRLKERKKAAEKAKVVKSPEVPLKKATLKEEPISKQDTKVKQEPPVKQESKDQLVTKKSNDATFITKIEKATIKVESDLDEKQKDQKEKLKKATSKPTFGKSKQTSKPM